jgi:hypothetical protein
VTGKICIRYKYLDDPDFNEDGTTQAPEEPGLLHYLKSGWSFTMTVAIDFTGSNGDPKHHESLHFFDPAHPQTLN